ncbi:cytochrome ubiquinol oxidase subunit I [Rhodovibrionaceae bacterium A322]
MTEFLDTVELSRLQFALTALYHFLFVPLTIGLALLLAIMETVYVMTNRVIWRDMVKFWGVLFGINFAMGVATGITMEFQFGMNWAYYSHYIGDIFGAPLAIEGMMAFFMEATFVGLFFFGWDRLTRIQHLTVTWLLAIATNFSALWILIANGWMQYPVGAEFNYQTMRMEVTDFAAVILNPVAQAKFVHTVSASYVTGAMFVLSISAFYLLRNRHKDLAKRSMTVAASFGLASALSVAVLGDDSGYTISEHQQMKLAAIEAEWHTQEAPADFNAIAWPDMERKENDFEIQIPYLLGIIATRSVDEEVQGIHELVHRAKGRIDQGIKAYAALEILRNNPDDADAKAEFVTHSRYLGYAFLLKRYRDDVTQATAEEIDKASWDTVPDVPVIFWAFRIMVACSMIFIALFFVAFVLSCMRRLDRYRLFLWAAFLSLPLPWVASEMGWIVAEYGRQPWIVEGLLPTFMGASDIPASNVWFSLIGFVVFYSALAVVDVWLMIKTIRKGPQSVSSPTRFYHPSPQNPAPSPNSGD